MAGAAALQAQGALPAGPKVKVVMVTQPGPGLPQYSTVDVPMLREGVPQKSGGRIEVELASWPERNLNGPEIIRLVRSGQVDIGAAPLATVSGDVPFLDIVDLAVLNPTIEAARKVADALALLPKRAHGAGVVVSEGRPVGIVTEGDLSGVDRFTQLGEVMSRDLMVLDADTGAQEAFEALDAAHRRLAPAVDREGRLVASTAQEGMIRVLGDAPPRRPMVG